MSKSIYNTKDNKLLRRSLRNNATSAEAVLWTRLKGKRVGGLKFRRQYGVGSYVLDLYCPEIRLAIELDGAAHEAPLAYEYDEIRTCYLESCGIRVIRFPNDVVFKNMKGIVRRILEVKDEIESVRIQTTPAPPILGGEINSQAKGGKNCD